MIDFEKFTPLERDNFVKNTLSEKEIRAAISAATKAGQIEKSPEDLLAFCFQVAIRKMNRLRESISKKRALIPQ